MRNAVTAPLVRDRAARMVMTADLLSKYGDWLVFLAANIVLFREGGALALGVYAVARVAVPILFTPVAGHIGMAVPARLLMVTSSVARGIVFALIGAATLLGERSVPVPVLVSMLVLASICASPYVAAEKRLIQASVSKDLLPALNSAMGVIATSSVIVAPAIGSVLLLWGGPATLFLVNAALYVVASVVLLGLPSDGAQASERRSGVLRGLRSGVGVIFADGRLRSMFLLQFAGSLVAGGTLVLLVPLAARTGQTGSAGFFTSVIGVASVVGALVGSRVAKRADYRLAIASVAACVPLVIGLPHLAGNVVLLSCALGLLGFLANVADPLYWTTFQTFVPTDRSGAAFGLIDAAITLAMVIGQGLVGFVLASFSLAVVGVVLGVIAGVLAGSSYVALRSRTPRSATVNSSAP